MNPRSATPTASRQHRRLPIGKVRDRSVAVPLASPRYASLAPLGLLAAGDWFEITAALIFFLVTGVAQWLQKRSQKSRGIPTSTNTETLPETWTDSGRTPPQVQTERPNPREFDIEEQLRRLLNPGQPPEPPPLPPRLPLTPPPRFDEEAESVSWESTDAPSRPLASFEKADAAYERGSKVEAAIARRLSSVGSLAHAASAFLHGSEIRDSVSARMLNAVGKTNAPAPSTANLLGSRTSAAAQSLSNTLRNRADVRQALLLSLILQPPRALEPYR